MALHYADTSALIKRYVQEVGTPWLVDLAATATLAISARCHVEFASALSRRTRERSLSEGERDLIYAAFLDDQSHYVRVPFDRDVVAAASSLCLATRLAAPLHALDAIHLASAHLLFGRSQERGFTIGSLITADRGLARAAVEIGLSVLDPLMSG